MTRSKFQVEAKIMLVFESWKGGGDTEEEE